MRNEFDIVDGVTRVYSSDDGGWYCEVWDRSSGREVHSTAICRTEREAVGLAESWVAVTKVGA